MRLVLLIFVIVCLNKQQLFSQSELFKLQWNITLKSMANLDTVTTSIIRTKTKVYRKKFKAKYESPTNYRVTRKVKVKNRRGNIVSKTKYKFKDRCIIKVLKINGELIMIKANYYDITISEITKNSFVNTGNNVWIWNYNSEKKLHHLF